MTDQTPYWIGLSMTPGVGPARTRLLLERFGTAEAAWNAPYTDLVYAGLDAKTADSLVNARRTANPNAELEKLDKLGGRALTWQSDGYPKRLLEVDDAPPVLYVRGELTESDDWAIGVVGTRRSTPYGREATARLSTELAQAKITIISGLARGIDTIAHRSALDAGGRTIAVMGSGLDVIYPAENRGLVQQMLDEGTGAIVTEYALGTQPDAMNFPPRNRIISGLSRGVLVVEADEKSGALITVRFALEQGRDVFAVPGPITSHVSAGTNGLLKQGAKCTTSAQDILEELNIGMAAEHVEAVRELPKDPTERMLLGFLEDSSQHIDDLTNKSGLPSSTVSAVLTMMELKGLVRHLGGMLYGAR